MKKIISYLVYATTAIFLLGVSSVNATLLLEISSSDDPTTILDESTLANTIITESQPGKAGSIFLSHGSWSIFFLGGQANPAVGSNYVAALNIDSVDVTGGVGTLTIKVTSTHYDNLGGNATFGVAATSDENSGTVRFQSFIDTSNAPGGGTLLVDTGDLNGPFHYGKGGETPTSDLFSLTTIATITHDSSKAVTSFSHTLKVPEPHTLALVGIGLITLGFIGIRRKPSV